MNIIVEINKELLQRNLEQQIVFEQEMIKFLKNGEKMNKNILQKIINRQKNIKI